MLVDVCFKGMFGLVFQWRMEIGDLRYRPKLYCALSFNPRLVHVPLQDTVPLCLREFLWPAFCHCLVGNFSLLVGVERVVDMLG